MFLTEKLLRLTGNPYVKSHDKSRNTKGLTTESNVPEALGVYPFYPPVAIKVMREFLTGQTP
jgi:hypothetical protein